MNFLDVLKEISPRDVRVEAERLFVLALVGHPEEVEAARRQILGLTAEDPAEVVDQALAAAEPYLCCATAPFSPEVETRLRYADLLVSLPGGPGPTDLRPADTLQITDLDGLIPAVVERRPELRVAMSRRFPGMRKSTAEQVIQDVSRVNAEFAAVAGIAGSFPWLAPLFPAIAGADFLVLTKNQVLMMFRLAAIFGEDLAVRSRVKEALPIIGAAVGWRTLGRYTAGWLPGGLGVPIKMALAFSATYVVGRTAQAIFETGRGPSRQEVKQIWEDGRNLAANYARQAADLVRPVAEEAREADAGAAQSPMADASEPEVKSHASEPGDTSHGTNDSESATEETPATDASQPEDAVCASPHAKADPGVAGEWMPPP